MPFNLSLFKKQAKQRVALDIGSQNTKMMAFQKGKAVVDKMLCERTPAGAFQAGSVLDEDSLSGFLAQCAGKLGIEGEIALIASVSGKGVIAKKIDIPQMDESMIPEFVEIEAEQELFYNKDEMDLDYEILQGVNFNKPEAQSLFVISVLKKTVESYNSAISKSMMSCDILDTNFSALFNVFERAENLDSKKIYMILDIGCLTTNLLIIINNQAVFARNLPFGGDFFNQGIQKKMNVDSQEAEELKLSASRGQESPQELVSLINNELNGAFVEELWSCYELYHSLFPEKNVDLAYVTGGASQTLGLVESLRERLGFPIQYFNPFKNIGFNPKLKEPGKELSLFSAVSTGLALRSLP